MQTETVVVPGIGEHRACFRSQREAVGEGGDAVAEPDLQPLGPEVVASLASVVRPILNVMRCNPPNTL